MMTKVFLSLSRQTAPLRSALFLQHLSKGKSVSSTKATIFTNTIQSREHFFPLNKGTNVDARRDFARSSAPPPSQETPADKAKTFVISLGHEEAVAQGVVDALKSSGISGEGLLTTVRTMSGRIEVGEDAGLEDLIEAVKQDLSRSEGKKVVRFFCVPPTAWDSSHPEDDKILNDADRETMMKQSFPVDCYEGMSLTDVAKFGSLEGASTLSEYIECACSGIMACSTCHVIMDKEWFPKVGEACEDEQDMIDLAYSPTSTSRLGCQVILNKKLDGLVVKLPKGANNIMDHIPFED